MFSNCAQIDSHRWQPNRDGKDLTAVFGEMLVAVVEVLQRVFLPMIADKLCDIPFLKLEGEAKTTAKAAIIHIDLKKPIESWRNSRAIHGSLSSLIFCS